MDTIRPNGTATCATLSAARARSLLGTDVGAGAKDLRKNEASRTQLDGCLYAAADGRRLGYLVWKLAEAEGAQAVREALPPVELGAKTFDPKIGKFSAGSVLGTGPVAIAQVNVAVGGRLFQVTVTERTAAAATKAAISAARQVMAP